MAYLAQDFSQTAGRDFSRKSGLKAHSLSTKNSLHDDSRRFRSTTQSDVAQTQVKRRHYPSRCLFWPHVTRVGIGPRSLFCRVLRPRGLTLRPRTATHFLSLAI